MVTWRGLKKGGWEKESIGDGEGGGAISDPGVPRLVCM